MRQMIDLSISRQQIDEIDSQIVELFEKRMKVANDVANYKIETGKAVFDKEREEKKLEKLGAMSHGEFNERAVRELFQQIMSISRKYQYGMLPHTDDVTEFKKVPHICGGDSSAGGGSYGTDYHEECKTCSGRCLYRESRRSEGCV